MSRIYVFLIGYLFGSIQAGYLYKKLKHMYYTKHKSDNSKEMVKATFWVVLGIIARIIDCLKVFIATLVVLYLLAEHTIVSTGIWILCYSCLGAILAHYYPCFLRFRGDKGIAVYWGVILSFIMNPTLVFMCAAVFLSELYVTKNVSRALNCLIIVFAVGFLISCYFGYWGIMYLGLNAIESNIVIITISMLVYHNYKKGAVASF